MASRRRAWCPLQTSRGTTMDHYAGLDVSLEYSSICVVDANGKVIREGRVASEPEALIAWFGSFANGLIRIGLEAGPLSQWLYAALKEVGLAVELLETRHVRDAFKAMPVKSDRNDARGIAQLMRLGWFRPVHCKSIGAQETRAMLTARKLVQSKLQDIENSLRGILRGFGLKVGHTTKRSFPGRIQELVAGHPNLETIAHALLSVQAVLLREFNSFEKRVRLGALGYKGQAIDVYASRRPDRGTHLCLRYRRPGAAQIVETGGFTFRAHPEEVPIRRDRPQRPDQQDRRCIGARGALPGRTRHAHQASQRMLGAQELGDADRQASRPAQGQGSARAQARRDHASHACQRRGFQSHHQDQTSRGNSLTRRNTRFRAGHDTSLPEAKSLRRDEAPRLQPAAA